VGSTPIKPPKIPLQASTDDFDDFAAFVSSPRRPPVDGAENETEIDIAQSEGFDEFEGFAEAKGKSTTSTSADFDDDFDFGETTKPAGKVFITLALH